MGMMRTAVIMWAYGIWHMAALAYTTGANGYVLTEGRGYAT